ncbi:hypothetical protein HRG_012624 [Hirsutella rhossiliensis]
MATAAPTPVDRVPPCPLLNASNTNETFRNAFVANPAGLMKEVFLVCNAAYKHPDPEAFTGEDPTLLPNFLQHLELKLEMNKDWWNSEPQRMGYVVSCLKGKAHDQVRYNIKDGVVLFDDVNAIKAPFSQPSGILTLKLPPNSKSLT